MQLAGGIPGVAGIGDFLIHVFGKKATLQHKRAGVWAVPDYAVIHGVCDRLDAAGIEGSAEYRRTCHGARYRKIDGAGVWGENGLSED
jgi:hypothetical protein